jgi:transcriptional regulator with XRE-family HTH domain
MRELVAEAGLNQEQLAAAVGVSPALISLLLAGERSCSSLVAVAITRCLTGDPDARGTALLFQAVPTMRRASHDALQTTSREGQNP